MSETTQVRDPLDPDVISKISSRSWRPLWAELNSTFHESIRSREVGLIRMIFWGMLFYFGYKVIKHAFSGNKKGSRVRGKPKKKSLDIDESQIEDADFKDLDE